MNLRERCCVGSPPIRSVSPDRRRRGLLASAAMTVCASSMLAPPAARAAAASGSAAADGAQIEEVVVTAQRREQNLQDVPISITALGAEAIRRGDVSTVSSLQGQVPGLKISAGAERTNISVRGIGSPITNIAAEAGVPVNIDGVYITRVTLFGATYNDLSQIEVLRGPQGTLYGRNATGGTVNIWSKTPDGSFGGDVSLLGGNGDRFRFRGAMGFPIDGDKLSARIGFDRETLDGYRDNLFLGEKADPERHTSGRAVLRWAPTEDFSVILRASIAKDIVGGPIIQYGGAVTAAPAGPVNRGRGLVSVDPTHINANERTRYDYRDQIYSATVNWNVGDVKLKSVTAFQRHKFDAVQDTDGTSAPFSNLYFLENSPAFTQELTVAGSTPSLEWIVGAWYLDDKANADYTIRLPGAGIPSLSILFEQKTKAYALFGQATYHVTERLRATVGLRYSDEKKLLIQSKTFPPPACSGVRTTNKYDDFSPKFVVDYTVAKNVMLYASATKGFKAGGGNTSVCGNTYGPERLWAYEAGVKSQWLDNRVRLNVGGFYYDYSGYQASKFAGDGTPSLVFTNAASATIKGIEAEFSAKPFDGFSIDAGALVNDAEFGKYISPLQIAPPGSTATVNLAGNRLPVAPKFSGSVAAQYEFPVSNVGTLTVRGEHVWSSAVYFDVFNVPFTRQGAYGMSNARISYRVERGSAEGLEVAAFIKNIENKDILNRSDYSGLYNGARNEYQRPRTYGAELNYTF